MQTLIPALVRLGLSEKEAAVYAAALVLGSATAQDIAKKAGVSRPTTYAALESLAERKLITPRGAGGKRQFLAQTPRQFEALFENEKAELAGRERVLRDTLPLLAAFFHTEGPRPHVRFLEGEEGLESVRRLFLSLKGESRQIVSYDDVLERRELHAGQKDHLTRLVANHVRTRAILVMKRPDKTRIPRLPDGEVRVVSADLLPMHGEVTVRGDMVFLYAYHPSILSVAITSREIAGALRALFDLAWKGAESVGEEL